MGSRHLWTEQEDATLRALLKTMSQAKAAKQMGMTVGQVRARADFYRTGRPNLYAMGRVCSECPGPLTDTAKGTRCRSCCIKAMNADRSFQEKRVAKLKEKWADPLFRAKMARVGGDTFRRALANNPNRRELLREWGRKIARDVLHSPEVRAKTLSPEAIAKRAKTQSETLMAWCPEAYRAEYRKLTVSQRFHAADARRIILDQVERDKAKERATLSPFERQELALQRGAKLVANDTAPSLSNPANYGEERWTYGR